TLNILPSELCNDQEFLRRAFLDLCGILPTPQDVRAFAADGAADKRATMIDRLLERPEFADLMAHHWLDVLRCNRLHLQIKGSHVYHGWLRRHIQDNTPWSQVVRELLTAGGSTFANPPANFYRGAYDSAAPATAPGDDRREALAEQVTAAGNPFFAAATVNRVWYMLLGRGIVDPPDDFRDSNPPANDALLAALAHDFVDHQFDMKRLVR